MRTLLHPVSKISFCHEATDEVVVHGRKDAANGGPIVDGVNRSSDQTLLPKLPIYGPGSHVGQHVLVSNVREKLGGPSTCMPQGSSPIASIPNRVALPKLTLCVPRGADDSSKANLKWPLRGQGGSVTERSSSDVKRGCRDLAVMLYKGDQTQRCQRRVLHENEPLADVPSHWSEFPVRDERGSSTKQQGRRSHSPPPTKQGNPERDRGIRACFRIEAAQIDGALHRLDQFQTGMIGGGQEVLVDTPNGEVNGLLEAFERSHLSSARVSPGAEQEDPIDREGLHGGPPEDTDKTATGAEIICAMATLNFVRWLCGLPRVEPNSVRLRICDMISHALNTNPTSSLSGVSAVHLLEFGDRLGNMLRAKDDRVSVMHGESSLIGAVEQGLSATHLVYWRKRWLAKEASREARAVEIALEFDVSGTNDLRKRQHGALNRQAQEARRQFTKAELPEALRFLKLFWDLDQRSRESGNTAGESSTREEIGGSGRADGNVSRQSRPHRHCRRRCIDTTTCVSTMPSGMSHVWGDRLGGMGLRRTLLCRDLREFGVARREDTCVIWTGRDVELDEPEALSEQNNSPGRTKNQRRHKTRAQVVTQSRLPSPAGSNIRVDAVCYPPPGIVPLSLIEGGCSPWTIMPDFARFQPTAHTCARMWRVRIERPSDREWVADRISEVVIQGFAVDCSTRGEPFCAVFWPDVKEFADSDQFEIVLSGLLGDKSELTYFYEFRLFKGQDANHGLCREAAGLRSILGDVTLWNEPKACTINETSQPVALSPRTASSSREVFERCTEFPLIETVSHHTTTFTTSRVDVAVVIRCRKVGCIQAVLKMMRGGDDEEEVPRAVHVLKLEGNYFFVRIKIPVARLRYKLRFRSSWAKDSGELHGHPFHYTILTTKDCQVLLSSLQDPSFPLFGLAQLSNAAQQYGVLVVAPLTHRIHLGRCYFLVRMDAAAALAAANACVEASIASKSDENSHALGGSEPSRAEIRGACDGTVPSSSLFSTRLLAHVAEPRRQDEEVRSVTTAVSGFVEAKEGDFTKMLQRLRTAIEPHCQDSAEEVHLDLALHDGECVHRLRRRHDFHELYEGIFTLNESDANTEVKLSIRFPRLHAAEFTPVVIARWGVVRNEHVPIGF
eukprot:TRINITY_DN55932_c0_g1_i1.p1 TRINITY_DN55932_c0_g1~~TRINITY_DN55932_c0_g1_i1.p1  ORF type:complete len:1127 (+),score=108.41 TRINITY_DN55932_c0_g1_i1:112-3492(+)